MSDTAHGHDTHGQAAHDDHDDSAHGGDPNDGVLRGTPPTPAWLLTAALIGLVTIIASVVLAVALNDAIPATAPDEIGVEGDAVPGDEPAPAEAEH